MIRNGDNNFGDQPPPLEREKTASDSSDGVTRKRFASSRRDWEQQLDDGKDWASGLKCLEMAKILKNLMNLVYGQLHRKPTFRYDALPQIQSIQRWMYDKYPKINKPQEGGMSLADIAWLTIAYLMHIDKTKHAALIETVNRVISEELGKLRPIPSREQLIAALESRLKVRLCGFHHCPANRLNPEFELLDMSVDTSNLKDQMRADEEKKELKRRLDNPQDYPTEERKVNPVFYDDEMDWDSLTPVELFAFSIPETDLEWYCSALIKSSSEKHLSFIGVCSRYFTWVGFKDALLQLYPRTSLQQYRIDYRVSDQVIAMVPRFEQMVRTNLRYEPGIDFNRKFRNLMWQMYMPAGCTEYHKSLHGELRAKVDQVYIKFKGGIDALDLTGTLADASVATLTQRIKTLAGDKVLTGEDPGYRDLYCFFQFTYIFYHQVRQPFLEDYVLLPDAVYQCRSKLSEFVATTLPPKLNRPLIIIFGGVILVMHLEQFIECPSLVMAVLLWVWLVRAFYGDALANDIPIRKISSILLPNGVKSPRNDPVPASVLAKLNFLEQAPPQLLAAIAVDAVSLPAPVSAASVTASSVPPASPASRLSRQPSKSAPLPSPPESASAPPPPPISPAPPPPPPPPPPPLPSQPVQPSPPAQTPPSNNGSGRIGMSPFMTAVLLAAIGVPISVSFTSTSHSSYSKNSSSQSQRASASEPLLSLPPPLPPPPSPSPSPPSTIQRSSSAAAAAASAAAPSLAESAAAAAHISWTDLD